VGSSSAASSGASTSSSPLRTRAYAMAIPITRRTMRKAARNDEVTNAPPDIEASPCRGGPPVGAPVALAAVRVGVNKYSKYAWMEFNRPATKLAEASLFLEIFGLLDLSIDPTTKPTTIRGTMIGICGMESPLFEQHLRPHNKAVYHNCTQFFTKSICSKFPPRNSIYSYY